MLNEVKSAILLVLLVVGQSFALEVNIGKKIKELDHKKPHVRVVAVKKLGRAIIQDRIDKIKKSEIVHKLIEIVQKDKDNNVRINTIEVLANIGDKSAVPQLIETIKNDKFQGARFSAVLGLGQLQDDSVISVLKDIFLNEKEDLGIRLQAGNALSYFAKKEIIDILEDGMKNENPKIRLQSVCSLGNMIENFMLQRKISLLTKALTDEDEKVSELAREILDRLNKLKGIKE